MASELLRIRRRIPWLIQRKSALILPVIVRLQRVASIAARIVKTRKIPRKSLATADILVARWSESTMA